MAILEPSPASSTVPVNSVSLLFSALRHLLGRSSEPDYLGTQRSWSDFVAKSLSKMNLRRSSQDNAAILVS